MEKQRTLSLDARECLGQEISVAGWVNSRRDHGGLIFIDLRDEKGILQLVVTPDTKDAFALAETVRDEFVLSAKGKMRNRADDLKNPNIPTGDVELVVNELKLLNKSDTPPVNTHDEGEKTGEELRLKYRYLDLRRPSMQNLIRRRSEFYRFMRDYMYKNDFTEVPTPILANSSPEGARDFLVPSRLKPGLFYALPQAPQQFKQLLMVGGVPRYFQIAPCFRDEDPRADRLYGDFYQLDLEMAFVDDGEIVREKMEPLIKNLVTDFAGKKLLTIYDGKRITDGSVPRITYREAMEKYGTDKPDLRFGMELVELTDVFEKTEFKVFKQPCVKAIRVPHGVDFTRSQIDKFTEKARKLGAGGLAYILYTGEASETGDAGDDSESATASVKTASAESVSAKTANTNSVETDSAKSASPEQALVKSPIAKFLSDAELKAIRERTGAKKGDAVFFGADEREKVNKVLGALRSEFADALELKDDSIVALCWVTDFPFYEWQENSKKLESAPGKSTDQASRGRLDFGHNPFSMPKGGLKALEDAKTDEERLEIVADQYDMVMNGSEICSGAVRNHDPEIMYKAFGNIGYTREYVAERFGGMLNAFRFGAPPHAGCAFGIDRIFMTLEDQENIRDIVAFPKNGSGYDLMMGAPSVVSEDQLEEAHLRIDDEA